MASDVGIGDAVEVLFVRLDGLDDGVNVSEVWMPATAVTRVERDGSISVAFAGGERMAVESKGWRRPGESGHGHGGGEDG